MAYTIPEDGVALTPTGADPEGNVPVTDWMPPIIVEKVVMEPMALDIANTWKAGPRVVDVEKGADTRTGGHQASAACFMAVLLVRASRSGPWHGEALANPMAV